MTKFEPPFRRILSAPDALRGGPIRERMQGAIRVSNITPGSSFIFESLWDSNARTIDGTLYRHARRDDAATDLGGQRESFYPTF